MTGTAKTRTTKPIETRALYTTTEMTAYALMFGCNSYVPLGRSLPDEIADQAFEESEEGGVRSTHGS